MTREELRKEFTDGVAQFQSHTYVWNHLLTETQRKMVLAWNGFVTDDVTLTNLSLDDVLRRYNSQ